MAVDLHPSGEKFISVGRDRERYVIKEWNIDGSLIKTLNRNNTEEVTAITYSPQGESIAIATDKGIEFRDLEENHLKTLKDWENNEESFIKAIAISPDSLAIATLNSEGAIQLRDSDGNFLTTFTNSENRPLVNLDFTADGQTIKAIDSYGGVSHWHLNLDRAIREGCNWLEDSTVTVEVGVCK